MLTNFTSDFLKNRNLEKNIADAEMSIKIGKLPPKSGELTALLQISDLSKFPAAKF
jgi:hypothetical protein